MILPTPQALAEAVNETMQALYGLDALMVGESGKDVTPYSDAAPTVVVPLIGDPLLLIAVHSAGPAGFALASIMFDCEPEDTTADMLEDALRELCNIVAGQVKTMVAQQHEIGLPSRLNDDDTWHELRHSSGVRLRLGQAQVDIVVGEFPGFSN